MNSPRLRAKGLFRPPLLLLLVLLAGCGGRPLGLPPAPAPAPSQLSPLLTQAQEAVHQGRYPQAELLLERAVRLQPRNPQPWHLLAQAKYRQGFYGQAIQFALRSNSLAPAAHSVTRENWRLLEQSYRQTGEKEKAAEAARRLQVGF